MINRFFLKSKRWKDQKIEDFQQRIETIEGILSTETWNSKIYIHF